MNSESQQYSSQSEQGQTYGAGGQAGGESPVPIPTDLSQKLSTVFGTQSARDQWLNQPNQNLDGQTPMAFIQRGRIDRVHQALDRERGGGQQSGTQSGGGKNR